MRFIIEFEGVVADAMPVWYEVYREVAAELGWSRVDEPTFRRLTRKRGRDADVLPGAPPIKRERFSAMYEERLNQDAVAERYAVRDEAAELLRLAVKDGSCICVTTAESPGPRAQLLESAGLSRFCARVESVARDPRRRPGELRVLAEGDPRTVVVASTDSLIRAAGAAELFAAGVASGSCSVDRLHAAGADVVYRDADQLIDSLGKGVPDMIRVGLLPPSSG